MDEPTQPVEPRRSRGFSWCLIWGFMIVALYVLSTGPLARLEGKALIRPPVSRVLTRLYAPCNWAYAKTPLHKPLGMYLQLWCPTYDKNGEQPQGMRVQVITP